MKNDKTEFRVISKLKNIFGSPPKPLLGIGDDAATFTPSRGKDIVWTVDSQIENVHFRWSWLSTFDVGNRSISVALSDLAAMGARPKYALIVFQVPPTFPTNDLFKIARGMKSACKRNQTIILGGNISRSKTFAIDVTAIGETKKGSSLKRSGAKAGDDLYVTGAPGASALGVHLLRQNKKNHLDAKKMIQKWRNPVPKIDLASKLVGIASAAIDISDGLLADARHIAEESHLDIIINTERLPWPKSFERAARLAGKKRTQIQFGPSDDYELLFTVPRRHRSKADRLFPRNVCRIGSAEEGAGRITLEGATGTIVTQFADGWDHFDGIVM